jgi:hypothetical protein
VYRHAATAIQGANTSFGAKSVLQKLARVLLYLDNVRTAYIARARRGDATEEAWFSPELEYHLWLDYTERAYHSAACASIEKRLGVSFDSVMARKEPHILTFSTLSNQLSGGKL